MASQFQQDPPFIINAALTGMIPTKADNPQVPITIEEIAADAQAVAEAGASIVHLHPRDEQGRPTTDLEIWQRLMGAVRKRCPELLICATCSGRLESDVERRATPLKLPSDLKPDLASLTLGSLNFRFQASVNAPDVIQALAKRMLEAGVKPELEVFELGMIHTGRYLLSQGLLQEPLYVNILLGNPGTSPFSALNLGCMLAALPAGTIWSVAGIGRHQLPANITALALGGSVRVGLEDNLYYDAQRTILATNRQLVERIVRIGAELGRRPATPQETRQMLQLPERA